MLCFLIIISLVGVNILEVWKKSNFDIDTGVELVKTQLSTPSIITEHKSEITEKHKDPELALKMVKIQCSTTISRIDRKKISRQFYEMEKNAHNGNQSEILACMKQQINHPETCEKILDDVKPGFSKRLLPTKVNTFVHDMNRRNWFM